MRLILRVILTVQATSLQGMGPRWHHYFWAEFRANTVMHAHLHNTSPHTSLEGTGLKWHNYFCNEFLQSIVWARNIDVGLWRVVQGCACCIMNMHSLVLGWSGWGGLVRGCWVKSAVYVPCLLPLFVAVLVYSFSACLILCNGMNSKKGTINLHQRGGPDWWNLGHKEYLLSCTNMYKILV